MIRYKIDVLKALEDKGWTQYKLWQHKHMSASTVQRFKTGDGPVTKATLDSLCKLLECSPGDLLEYVPDKLK